MARLCPLILAAAIAASGCELANFIPPEVPPGGRIIIVTVENRSPGAANLIVGLWKESDKENGIDRPIQAVGSAQPAYVSAGAIANVKFGVPAGTDWAIFVNPGPTRGLLFTANDAPSGSVAFKVVVERDGEPYMWYPTDPGWNAPAPTPRT